MSTNLFSSAEVYRRAGKHVFLVVSEKCDSRGCGTSAGTAWALKHPTLGIIGATAAHVLATSADGSTPVDQFKIFDGQRKETFDARVLAISADTDTAFLSFDVPLTDGLSVETAELAVGLDIVSVGNDAAIPYRMGGGHVVKRGNISAIRHTARPKFEGNGLFIPENGRIVQWIQGSIPIVGGASGGPWISQETGRVVGITSWGIQETGSDNFAVGPKTINEELDRLQSLSKTTNVGMLELSPGITVASDVKGKLVVFTRTGWNGWGGLVRPPRRRCWWKATLLNPIRRVVGGKPVDLKPRLNQDYLTLSGVESRQVTTMGELLAAIKGARHGEWLRFIFTKPCGTNFTWMLRASNHLVSKAA